MGTDRDKDRVQWIRARLTRMGVVDKDAAHKDAARMDVARKYRYGGQG